MIGEILPPEAAHAEEIGGSCLQDDPWPDEEEDVAGAVASRRAEYLGGRRCARQALRQLGVTPQNIGRGAHGEPIWPTGIIGSITHCPGYRAAAVALRADLDGIGIDAEIHRALPDEVLDLVSSQAERREFPDPRRAVHWDCVLFSAKEAIYKAFFPLSHSWLGFEDVHLTIDAEAGTFNGQLLSTASRPHGSDLTELSGRFRVTCGIIMSTVAVGRSSR